MSRSKLLTEINLLMEHNKKLHRKYVRVTSKRYKESTAGLIKKMDSLDEQKLKEIVVHFKKINKKINTSTKQAKDGKWDHGGWPNFPPPEPDCD